MSQKLSPTLTILTRCHQDKKQLIRCKTSLQLQTDPDFEHIIFSGSTSPVRQIAEVAEKIRGEWIYVLNDKSFLTCQTFIEQFKDLIKKCNPALNPDVVIVKGWIKTTESPSIWNGIPLAGKIIWPNIISKRAVFEKYCLDFDCNRRADHQYISRVWQELHSIYWWDKSIFYEGE